MNKKYIEIDRDLKDLIISSFRYALGRNTYMTLLTCDYIKNHPELVDERVKNILLKDSEQLDFYYPKKGIDYEIFINFRMWLENLEVK